MFMKYDENTEEHVRKGFRLPPLFLGEATDYSFATAKTSYMVAEAQVFAPERTEFDEYVNKTIVKEMGWKSLKFKSLPITLKDVDAQLKALELSKDVASRESLLKEVNTASNMTLELGELAHPNVAEGEVHPGVPTVAEVPHEKLPASTKPSQPSSPQPVSPELPPTKSEQEMEKLKLEEQRQKVLQLKKKKTARELIDLTYDYAAVKGLVQKRDITPERALLIRDAVAELHPDDVDAFNDLLAQYTFGSSNSDLMDITRHLHD